MRPNVDVVDVINAFSVCQDNAVPGPFVEAVCTSHFGLGTVVFVVRSLLFHRGHLSRQPPLVDLTEHVDQVALGVFLHAQKQSHQRQDTGGWGNE